MYMKPTKNIRGMSLIEVVVSLAIIAIIVAGFSGAFVSGFKGIVNAGNKSKADYITQKVVENKLGSQSPAVPHTTVTETPGTLSITFGTYSITVRGKKVLNRYNDGKQDVTMAVFIPD